MRAAPSPAASTVAVMASAPVGAAAPAWSGMDQGAVGLRIAIDQEEWRGTHSPFSAQGDLDWEDLARFVERRGPPDQAHFIARFVDAAG